MSEERREDIPHDAGEGEVEEKERLVPTIIVVSLWCGEERVMVSTARRCVCV